jgi:hypothetical protein
LWRRLVVFVVVTTVMVLAVLLSRDTQQLRAMKKQGEMIAAVLRESYLRRQDPPLRFPPLDPPNERLYEAYEYNMFYAIQAERGPRVGVCCSKRPVEFFVLTEGRIVILFDGEDYSSQWMPEREFRDQADRLGLGSLLKRQPPYRAPQP